MFKKWTVNILIGVDQLFNAVLRGDPDETISSRAGKRDGSHKVATAICWALDKVDPGHCKDAIEEDEGKDAL